jgi:REP-associated tyrosine transposase
MCSMARIPRVVVPGHPHRVTQRGVRGVELFAADGQWQAYLRFTAEQCERFGAAVLAWCLLPGSSCLVMVPGTAGALAKAVGEAHKRYTRWKNAVEGVRGFLFEGRFGSCVLDGRHLLAAVREAETAPVRAGLAESPGDWPWSSARYHLGRSSTDALVRPGGGPEVSGSWADFLKAEDPGIEASVRACTRSGRPAGDRRFLVRMERLTGRGLRRHKPGRKKRLDDGPGTR